MFSVFAKWNSLQVLVVLDPQPNVVLFLWMSSEYVVSITIICVILQLVL
jgi:hypothetical protein